MGHDEENFRRIIEQEYVVVQRGKGLNNGEVSGGR